MTAEFLAACAAAASASPAEELRQVRGRALVTVFSDFWDEATARAATGLSASGAQVNLIHLLSRAELDPLVRGAVQLADAESGETVSRFVDREELDAYGRLLQEHCATLRGEARRREIGYLRCASDEPFENIVMVHLRGEGVLE